jgi:MYXO-CTERM domain-containing protein
VIYIVLWLYGVLTTQRSGANFVPANNEDDYRHLVLGLGMLALGFLLGRREQRRPVRAL